MTTALIDTRSGNLHSAQKAFEMMAARTGAGKVIVTDRPEAVLAAERIVLPGDGAFAACARELRAIDGMIEALEEAVIKQAKPFLGICVGMQLLATRGFEHDETEGLGWIEGEIHRIEAPGRKVPHMGWNDLVIERPHALLGGIETGDHAYFVHSYAMRLADAAERIAYAEYGGEITAIVARGNIAGTQFHPEKSQGPGLRLIANFLSWAP